MAKSSCTGRLSDGCRETYKAYFGSEHKTPNILDFLNVDTCTFAQQMTLAAADLYGKVTSSECEIWSALAKHNTMPEQTPHINAVIQHNNEIRNWALRVLIELTSQKKQLQATYHLIAIADACRVVNNFATLVAIISASTDDQAQRAINNINSTARAKLKQLQTLVSPAKGFIELRQAIRFAKLPCIPFLGFMLTDLRFIEEGMPSLKRDGTHNNAKSSKTKEVIVEIQRYQSRTFQIVSRPDVQELMSASLKGIS